MKRLSVMAALIVFSSFAAAESFSDDTIGKANKQRFQLWNQCRPVSLLVEGLSDDATAIGLSRERIETVVRSRLRAARIFEDTNPFVNVFYVNVFVFRSAYGMHTSLIKYVYDPESDSIELAETWKRDHYGFHGQDSDFIIQRVSERTDEFIDEYRRVNEEAC